MPTPPYRRTVARAWDFPPEDRTAVTFTGSARLDGKLCTLALRADAAGKYPITGEHTARLQAFAPQAVRQWRSLDVVADTPAGTAITWRLYDGTSAWWWTGAAWAVAGSGQWSTLADVQAHLGTFPVTARRLQPVVRLATTDRRVTPQVHRVVVVLDADVPSFAEEVLDRTLLHQIAANVRTLADVQVAWAATGTSGTLVQADLPEPPGVLADVVGAYAVVADPTLATNLLQSYNPSTGAIVLTASQPAGTEIRLRVLGKPTTAMATHGDYDEVGLLPAVLVDSVEESLQVEPLAHEATVDRTTNVALVVPPPRQVRYDLSLRVVAARGLDLQRTAEALETFLRSNPLLVSAALDDRVGVAITVPLRTLPSGNLLNQQEGTLQIRLWAAPKWTLLPAGAAYGTTAVVLDGSLDGTIT
jgi:hypothetical protein